MRVQSSDQAVTEVVAKELALLRPAVRGDRATVLGLLHEDFVEFGASGRIWDRTQIADALARDPGDVTPEAEEMRAVRLDEHVILLTYRARRPDRVSLRSSLWRHSAAGWQLFFHQGTLSS
jgi:hypothetical protein